MGYKKGFKLLNSKKGMDIELWFNVFELVIVFLVGIVLLDTVNSEAKGNTFEKIYYSRDSALLINTLYAGQGDIEYTYPEKTEDYIFDFKPNKVGVYLSHELVEGGVVEYPFAEDSNYQFFYNKITPKDTQDKKITYSKSKNTINIH